jgi:NADH-quinone oxidoreductase subunit C
MDAPEVASQTDLEHSPIVRPIVQKLRAWNPVVEVLTFRGELTVLVQPENLRHTAEFLRADPALSFDFLSDIAAVDRYPTEPRFELNYELTSLAHRHNLRLRIKVPGETNPQVETVTAVWPAANWLEREIFDLFGVRFLGHPDLRRILMPEDWEGHPLRKDYPVEGFR